MAPQVEELHKKKTVAHPVVELRTTRPGNLLQFTIENGHRNS